MNYSLALLHREFTHEVIFPFNAPTINEMYNKVKFSRLYYLFSISFSLRTLVTVMHVSVGICIWEACCAWSKWTELFIFLNISLIQPFKWAPFHITYLSILYIHIILRVCVLKTWDVNEFHICFLLVPLSSLTLWVILSCPNLN